MMIQTFTYSFTYLSLVLTFPPDGIPTEEREVSEYVLPKS